MIQTAPSHKPKLYLRIGITGSHLGELPRNLYVRRVIAKISRILQLIKHEANELSDLGKDFYDNTPPKLRLIFAPAGGLEYLAAGEALHLGYELQMLLPFSKRDYTRTFLSRKSCRPLLRAFKIVTKNAKEIVELDGSVENLSDSLRGAGQISLLQCDVLIVLWSGEQTGIGQLVQEALSRGIPIIWIPPHSNRSTVLYERGLNRGDLPRKIRPARLAERLKTIFLLPRKANTRGKALAEFLGKRHPRKIPLFRKFRDLIAQGWDKGLPEAADGEQELPKDHWDYLENPNNGIGSKVELRIKKHFSRADSLADAYGDLYRSFFLATYGLGALAVLSAFCGIYLKEHTAFEVELALIFLITAIVAVANYLHIHQRWIDYRLLSEGFRQMEFLAPLARVTPAFEVPAHLDHDDPGRTWFNWYFRAIIRETGLISVRMNEEFLEKSREVLAHAVKGQVHYHARTGKKMELLHHRLHLLVVWVLFPATLIACVIHLLPHHTLEKWLGSFGLERIDFFLSLGAIIFPALGAAIEGIIHQGEFDRIDKRSQALSSRLKALHTRLTVTEKPQTSKELGIFAEEFGQIQILEQADWRAAFVSKPISLT